MIQDFRYWLTAPRSKIHKITYGDGGVMYQAFLKRGIFARWCQVIDYSDYNSSLFDKLDDCQDLLNRRLAGIERDRIKKVDRV